MKHTRKHFTHDHLISEIRQSFEIGLKREKVTSSSREKFSATDCLMAGLSVFTFKQASLLSFERAVDEGLSENLKQLFELDKVPSDTQMRARLDELSPNVIRPAFQRLLTLLQRGKILDQFRFLEKHYLISLDGTGVFSSSTVHCENCCVKEHRDESKTYYHQTLGAALVHPNQSVVFPLAPEPIMKTDGDKKNDCERNAAKRWLADFKREHPHLSGVILADGLSSNAPFIREIQKHGLSFLLICKDKDHKYLVDWLDTADEEDSPQWTETTHGEERVYQYMKEVPLNASHQGLRVSVVRYKETKEIKGKTKTRTWMWVTDLPVSRHNIKEIIKGGRARWKIENETFNTLKNQGYQFEHNFGHGNKNLSTVFTSLMVLSFFVDQCLMRLNKRFQVARNLGSLRCFWERMRSVIRQAVVPSFEALYEAVIRPPPKIYLQNPL